MFNDRFDPPPTPLLIWGMAVFSLVATFLKILGSLDPTIAPGAPDIGTGLV
jgi:hypothetical protein